MRDNMLNDIYKELDQKQADDILILEVANITSIAEYFVIASADNERKVRAIAESIEDTLAKMGTEPKAKEGFESSRWILLDYGDIMVHIFKDDERSFYKLEKVFKDAIDITSEFVN